MRARPHTPAYLLSVNICIAWCGPDRQDASTTLTALTEEPAPGMASRTDIPPSVRLSELHGDLYLSDRMRWPGHLGLLRLSTNVPTISSPCKSLRLFWYQNKTNDQLRASSASFRVKSNHSGLVISYANGL